MPINERLLNVINNRRKDTVKPNLATKILELYGKNLHLLIWQIVLIIGAFIFVLHFFHIRFVPDFNITSLLGVFGLAALTGLLFVGVFIAGFLYPLIFWFITLNSARGKEFAAQLQTHRSNEIKEKRVKETKALENLPVENTEFTNCAEDEKQWKINKRFAHKWKNWTNKLKNKVASLINEVAARSIFILFFFPLIVGWAVLIYFAYYYAPVANSL